MRFAQKQKLHIEIDGVVKNKMSCNNDYDNLPSILIEIQQKYSPEIHEKMFLDPA